MLLHADGDRMTEEYGQKVARVVRLQLFVGGVDIKFSGANIQVRMLLAYILSVQKYSVFFVDGYS